MRIAALALVSALISVLAACNPSAPSGGAAFPDLNSASYRAEATIQGADDGHTLPVVMIRSGNKVRMEITSAQGGAIVVNNPETSENFVLMTQGGRTFAMQADPTQYEDPTAAWNAEYASTATRTGDCTVAGETGHEWTRAAATAEEIDAAAKRTPPIELSDEPSTTCVTEDGILLRITQGERVAWETTSVQRGPQDAALFTLPPGVQVMDLGSMMTPTAGASAGVNAQICDALRNAGAPADRLAQAGC
jgi:hypothetical protein